MSEQEGSRKGKPATSPADDAWVDPEAATQLSGERPSPSSAPAPAAEALGEAATIVRPRAEGASGAGSSAAAGARDEPQADPAAPIPPTRVLPPDGGVGHGVPPSGIAPGSVLFGEYEIIEVLGAGGMGEVYRAKHRRLGEYRAIKMMHADLASKRGANEFFLREAKALLAVRHPSVVHCHDLLSDEHGRVFLVMEMIEGVSLGERIEEGPVPADQVVLLGARLAAGLHAAHACGVVHRDVSPDNVVLPNGDVENAKLIDFGIAKILEEGQGTIVDGFKGKLSYASPEQLGFFGGRIDGRSDFYSLGLVLCAAAMGRPMGMGTTVVEAVDARRAFQNVPETIPIGLRSSIEPLLALDPRNRPDNPEPLFLAPGGDQSGLAAIRAEAQRSRQRSGPTPMLWLRGGVATLAVALAAAGYWLLAPGGGESVEQSAVPSETSRGTPAAIVAPSAVGEVVAKPVPVKAEAAPEKRRLSALDEVRIVGLLRGAEAALADNRLQSPKGDNAYEKYRGVLALDPDNKAAERGLATVAARYLQLANGALARGQTERARDFVSRAAAIDSGVSGLEQARAKVDAASSE